MPVAVQVLAGLAAAIHVVIFFLGAVSFGKPAVHWLFGAADTDEMRVLKGALVSQGFHNLFLAIGVVAGLLLVQFGTDPDSFWVTAVGADVFGTSPHDTKSLDALNQSRATLPTGSHAWGPPIITFALACMAAAALVLLASSRGKMLRAALIQGLLPVIALTALVLSTS